jgi:MFS family permease
MTARTEGRSRWLALVIVCIGNLMIVLDVTIVGVALPSIRQDLGFSESSLAWVANAYLLTFGGFLPGSATCSATGASTCSGSASSRSRRSRAGWPARGRR